MRKYVTAVLRKKPVEIASSLLMIVAGTYLSTTSASGSAGVIVGNLLSALGGVLISWSASHLTSTEAAAEILRPQLAAIGRQLVTVSGQISKAVNDARSDELDPSIALEMVSQASRIMYASVNELHVVLGQPVESQELLETAHRVEELAAKLAGTPGVAQQVVESQLAEAVAELRSQIQGLTGRSALKRQASKLIPKSASHELESVGLKCPVCDAKNVIAIGRHFGSSAMPQCDGCGVKFHAHRSQDGSVFTNAPGGGRWK